MAQSNRPSEFNRRDFLKTSALAAGGLAAGALGGCAGQMGILDGRNAKSTAIIVEPNDTIAASRPARWAVNETLLPHLRGGQVYGSLDQTSPDANCIVVAGRNSQWLRDFHPAISFPDQPEALVLARGKLGNRDVLLAAGNDPRGIVYAVTELGDAIALNSDPWAKLQSTGPVIEHPANSVRSVMRMFVTDVEDKSWYNDRGFWREYLTMLVANRFNRVNLSLGLGYDSPSGLRDSYFFFPYPFLLPVPGYDVKATNLPDSERDSNLEMLRFISDEAAARGLHFQLGLWTHAYVFTNSANVNHRIEGLTDATHGPYCRDALALLLKQCPNIAGVTFRIHGESGVPEGSYDLWRTIFEGVVRSGRRMPIDMHAKGMDQKMIETALSTGLPITISPKFWAEHMGLPYHQAAIRPTELPVPGRRGSGAMVLSSGERSFTRYGYGDLLPEDRKYGIIHRMWPGTQRVLLWGDPVFAAAYGRSSSFCGSLGCEIMEPLSFKGRKGSGLPGGRDGYADLSLRAAGGDFAKFSYSYRLWGRLLYNPDADPEIWRRQLRHDYGRAAEPVESALASASRILPLFTTAHTPAAANNNYWPEMYVNMSIIDERATAPYGGSETPAPRRFGTVNPLDSQLFSRVDDYVDQQLKGEPAGKYSPIEVAQWLEDFAQAATERLTDAQSRADRADQSFRRLWIDVSAQIALGRFFGKKLRAAALWALYDRTGDKAALDEALKCYRLARENWGKLVDLTKDVYVADMSYGSGWFQRGHWSDRLAAIDADIEAMAAHPASVQPGATAPSAVVSMIRLSLNPPQRPRINAAHTPPGPFRRGQAVPIALSLASQRPAPKAVQLYYRHTHQAEQWQIAPMQVNGDRFEATIPAEYTDTPQPLEYYFEVVTNSPQPALYPGFNATLSNQPYFVLRQG